MIYVDLTGVDTNGWRTWLPSNDDLPHYSFTPHSVGATLLPSQHARAGPLRVKCGQCGLVRASQNRKGPVQVRCSFHEGKVQFSSGLSSIANVYRNRAVPVQFGK